MPRPKKPSHLIEIAGGFAKHPERRRPGEPTPSSAIGSAPEKRSTDFAAVWDEVVSIVPPGVLGNSDRIWLEITCNLLIQYRREPEQMVAARVRLLQNCLVKLGLNPSDRANLCVIDEQRDPIEDKYF